jgi:nitrous oxide reductase
MLGYRCLEQRLIIITSRGIAMNKEDISPNQARRGFLKQTAAVAIAAPALALTATRAFAAGAPKSSVQYQDKPKNNQKCSECVYYIPSKSGGKGKCQVVQGTISPQGWCSLYQAK